MPQCCERIEQGSCTFWCSANQTRHREDIFGFHTSSLCSSTWFANSLATSPLVTENATESSSLYFLIVPILCLTIALHQRDFTSRQFGRCWIKFLQQQIVKYRPFSTGDNKTSGQQQSSLACLICEPMTKKLRCLRIQQYCDLIRVLMLEYHWSSPHCLGGRPKLAASARKDFTQWSTLLVPGSPAAWMNFWKAVVCSLRLFWRETARALHCQSLVENAKILSAISLIASS